MASDPLSLADLIIINDLAALENDVSDLLQDAPLLARMAADTASNGTVHQYIKETGAPVVGFRAENAGRDHDSSIDATVTSTLKIMDASFHVDLALANAYRHGPEAWIAREGERHIRAAFKKAEKQVINGDDAAGFSGFAQAMTAFVPTVTNEDATGGSELTSIYLLKNGVDDCQFILGRDGQIDIGEATTQMLDDGTGKYLPVYQVPISAWMTVQVGGLYSLGRIANISNGDDVTASDDLIYDNLVKWEDRTPDLIVMNRRTLEQIRASRTATNATGVAAPLPTEIAGIPLVVTSSIGVAEAEL